MKRKLIYGLLAVLISFGLWLYVVTVVNPEWDETFYNIPVVLENEEILHDRGLMLVSKADPKVTLRLSGNRTDMIKLNASNITIRADLSRIYSAGEQSLHYDIVYPGDVPNNAFEIISQTPQQITLSVTERKSKAVEVLVVYDGTVPEQYIAFKDKATLDLEKINITGPAEVIDKIAYAKVAVNLENQKESISQQYSYVLCDSDGNPVESDWITADAEQVLYTLRIQQWKDISLRVDVVEGGGLKASDCTISMAVSTIRVAGPEKQLADLGDELVIGQIKLGQILNNTVLTYEIKLPEGITNLSEKNMVDVSVGVERPGITYKTLTVNTFQKVELPQGKDAIIATTEKEVTVRGPQAYLDLITPQDMLIQVYFTDAQLGTDTFEAKAVITNPELAAALGVMDIDNVTATVTG